jgi:hypothetical protein
MSVTASTLDNAPLLHPQIPPSLYSHRCGLTLLLMNGVSILNKGGVQTWPQADQPSQEIELQSTWSIYHACAPHDSALPKAVCAPIWRMRSVPIYHACEPHHDVSHSSALLKAGCPNVADDIISC